MTLFLLFKCFKIALAGWLSQLELSSHTAKGRGCDPGSGHIPRLLVRCPGLVCMGGNCLSLMFLCVCVCLSLLPLSLSVSLKSIKMSSSEDFKKWFKTHLFTQGFCKYASWTTDLSILWNVLDVQILGPPKGLLGFFTELSVAWKTSTFFTEIRKQQEHFPRWILALTSS